MRQKLKLPSRGVGLVDLEWPLGRAESGKIHSIVIGNFRRVPRVCWTDVSVSRDGQVTDM
jgi:hypothetical protein